MQTHEVPDQTPAYIRYHCEGCTRVIWYRLSRVAPKAWTEEDFLNFFDVDKAGRKITEKVST